MGIIENSSYRAPAGFSNPHLQTILPSLFRKVKGLPLPEKRCIELPDGDFLALDIYQNQNSGNSSKKAVIISHGLEGNSSRAYVLGMAKAFLRSGWHAIAWNFRGCAGMNRLPRFYHSGDTADLACVAKYATQELGYTSLCLTGFSMGGNITLKYAGEQGDALPAEIRALCAFSVPCHLESSAMRLSEVFGGLYVKRFLRMLKAKITEKEAAMPGTFDLSKLREIRNFKSFDDAFTAPLHGFISAEDYWHKSSSLHVLGQIKRPALLVNALDDPFLTPKCYPRTQAASHSYLHLELPCRGGHAGFLSFGRPDGLYWSETRAVNFAQDHISG
ncbi:MAG: alpha/beta fold hydrolase [Balneolales bacterium]|nr:alpha/beta fold hydrolase [Balneolales bacterium]